MANIGPKAEPIAVKNFDVLYLDYEFPAEPFYNMPAYVSCRVTSDGWFKTRFNAESREKAIEMFFSGQYEAA